MDQTSAGYCFANEENRPVERNKVLRALLRRRNCNLRHDRRSRDLETSPLSLDEEFHPREEEVERVCFDDQNELR